MFKRLIKNIIPISLLLHISSCSSFGVSKSEMNGACGIIDATLNYSGNENFDRIQDSIDFNKSLREQQTIKDISYEKIQNILGDETNKLCLKQLKTNIATWGKRDFIEAVNDCFRYDYEFFTQGQRFSSSDIEDLSEKIDFENSIKLFKNLCIIKNPQDKKDYEQKCTNATNSFIKNNNIKNLKDILNEYFIESKGKGHLACARLIAVDLIDNKLTYRVKYLPYIFKSGSSNKYAIHKQLKKNLKNSADYKLLDCTRSIDDYLFQNEDDKVYKKSDKSRNLDNGNSHHTDSERALFLCLAADGNNIKLDPKLGDNTENKEPMNKLKNFVTEKTIDLCIQIRNMKEMCGSCQCLYAGIDKLDLNQKKFVFRRNDNGNIQNILSVLQNMGNGNTNDYKKSLVLATRQDASKQYFGTKIFMGDQRRLDECTQNEQFYKNIKINYDKEAKTSYSDAKNTYYEPKTIMYEYKFR